VAGSESGRPVTGGSLPWILGRVFWWWRRISESLLELLVGVLQGFEQSASVDCRHEDSS